MRMVYSSSTNWLSRYSPKARLLISVLMAIGRIFHFRVTSLPANTLLWAEFSEQAAYFWVLAFVRSHTPADVVVKVLFWVLALSCGRKRSTMLSSHDFLSILKGACLLFL